MLLRRSNSFGSMRTSNACYAHSVRGVTTNAVFCLTMGPVATAVGLFVAEKAITRAMKGQLLRKGVVRKIRRLAHMFLKFDILYDMLCDMLEDVQ